MKEDQIEDQKKNQKNYKKDTKKKKKNAKDAPWKWIVTIFILTILISGTFSFLSNIILDAAGMTISLIVLLMIVLIGIVFDIIGVAVTAADVQSIHGMASRRIKGADVAANLIKSANKVSSICNDVIGDICGIVSGTATAVIAARIMIATDIPAIQKVIPIALSAIVAALTVSGKAIGKIIALNKSTDIIFMAGKFLAIFRIKKKTKHHKSSKR